jgi:DNA-binding transcriptional MocR family regulator
VPLDPDDPRPPYLQIAEQLAAAIRDGTYPDGTKIPSETMLTSEYGVARMTVRNAVGELAKRGLVVKRHGSGVFVRIAPPHRGFGNQMGASVIEPAEGGTDPLRAERDALANLIDPLDQTNPQGRRAGFLPLADAYSAADRILGAEFRRVPEDAETVERVAKAMAEADGWDWGDHDDDIEPGRAMQCDFPPGELYRTEYGAKTKPKYRHRAAAAIAALRGGSNG